ISATWASEIQSPVSGSRTAPGHLTGIHGGLVDRGDGPLDGRVARQRHREASTVASAGTNHSAGAVGRIPTHHELTAHASSAGGRDGLGDHPPRTFTGAGLAG